MSTGTFLPADFCVPKSHRRLGRRRYSFQNSAMNFFQKITQRYTGFIRSLKGVYVLNNLLHRKELEHNRQLYKKHHVQKSIFSPIGSKDFKGETTGEIPWIDSSDAVRKLEQSADFQAFAKEMQNQIRHFITEGYMVLKGVYDEETCDRLSAEVDAHLKDGKAGFNYTGRKIFNYHEQSELADKTFFRNPEILRLFRFLMGKEIVPFQSLNFVQGSEQRAHSDSIHMTTEPKGYMIASWTALEDTTMDNGPLFYYPKSHLLPYVMTEDYDSGNSFLLIGAESNRKYEDHIEKVIHEQNLEKKYFLAKKGDVLIWHANLLHGGSPIAREGATRKSMVSHYFCEGVICYHEMSQRPALLKR